MTRLLAISAHFVALLITLILIWLVFTDLDQSRYPILIGAGMFGLQLKKGN